MLKYELLHRKENDYIYEYYPEGQFDNPGKVSISTDGEKKILEISEHDFSNIYAGHALKGIVPGSKSGTIAWY